VLVHSDFCAPAPGSKRPVNAPRTTDDEFKCFHFDIRTCAITVDNRNHTIVQIASTSKRVTESDHGDAVVVPQVAHDTDTTLKLCRYIPHGIHLNIRLCVLGGVCL